MFEFSEKSKSYQKRVGAFFHEHIVPNDAKVAEAHGNGHGGDRWQPIQIIEDLKEKAKEAGLWNMFLPESQRGAGLSNLDYAPICEIIGRYPWSSEVFNCSAPDTGNMEVLERYGSEEIKKKYLQPLLDGKIRSCFAMTEPAVASSDATNIQSSIQRDGDEYVINGTKWWSSGAGDPRCKIAIFMGKTDFNAPKHAQQSMIVVPFDTPGITIKRMLTVFGNDHAPHGHGEVTYKDVRVPAAQPAAGRRPRLRDRAGTAGPRPHPPLHARDRHGGARARADGQALPRARRVRQAARGVRLDPPGHRQVAHGDRAGPPAGAQGGAHDGHRGQQGGAPRDRDDQGDRAQHAAQRPRPRDPGARRRRRVAGHLPRRRPGWERARCASPTVPTRCTWRRWPGSRCGRSATSVAIR